MYIMLSAICFGNQFSHKDKPWSTGVLLNEGAIQVEKGSISSFTDFYNTQELAVQQWGVYSQNAYGLSDHWSVQIIPAYNYNVSGGRTATAWGDLTTLLGYQLNYQSVGSDWPSIRADFTTVFPVGRYNNLDFNNNGFDATGRGSYVIGMIINTEYLSMPIPDHFLNTYFSVGYTYWTPVHLSGLNQYGGGLGTNGRLGSSDEFLTNLAFEFHLNRHWAAIFEAFYLFNSPASFKGNPGQGLDGREVTVLREGLSQFSLAPALEYNFSDYVGIVGGGWFSLNDNSINKFRSYQLGLSISIPDF